MLPVDTESFGSWNLADNLHGAYVVLGVLRSDDAGLAVLPEAPRDVFSVYVSAPGFVPPLKLQLTVFR